MRCRCSCRPDRGDGRHLRAVRHRLGRRDRGAHAADGQAGAGQPARDARYTTEFYALSSSVRAAQKSGEIRGARQLRAAGRARQDQQAARRQRPGRRAGGRLAVAVRLRPARAATSTSSRAASIACIRFRIDGVLHTVYQVPLGVMSAMTARIKLLGRMDVVEKRRPLDGRIKTAPNVDGRRRGRDAPVDACRPRSARRW